MAGRYEDHKVNVTSFPAVSTGVPQTYSETKFSATKPMFAVLYRPIDSAALRQLQHVISAAAVFESGPGVSRVRRPPR